MSFCSPPRRHQPVAWSYNQPSFASRMVPFLADCQCFLCSLLAAAGSLVSQMWGKFLQGLFRWTCLTSTFVTAALFVPEGREVGRCATGCCQLPVLSTCGHKWVSEACSALCIVLLLGSVRCLLLRAPLHWFARDRFAVLYAACMLCLLCLKVLLFCGATVLRRCDTNYRSSVSPALLFKVIFFAGGPFFYSFMLLCTDYCSCYKSSSIQ